MFDQLFKRRFAVLRHQNGPLSEERRAYLAHCAEQEMTLETRRGVACYILNVAEWMKLAGRAGELISRDEIEREAVRWEAKDGRTRTEEDAHRLRTRFKGHAVRWLGYVDRLAPVVIKEPASAGLVTQFAGYSREERGLSSKTIALNSKTVQAFLNRIEDAGCQLETLTASQLDHAATGGSESDHLAPVTIKRCITTVRSFLRFAEERGWCPRGLAGTLQTPRVYSMAGLPTGPCWDDVKAILSSVKGSRPYEIRDRALLLLLAVYGLRSGEVVALRLEDFDWDREMQTVPFSKSRRQRTYPLCRQVGDAVLRYLKEVRPRSRHRQVFLTLLAPYRPLASKTPGGVATRRIQDAGIALPRSGAHVLRHACASHLVASGLSLKEVGDHLGHRSPDATRIYAKVDLESLRCVGELSLKGLA